MSLVERGKSALIEAQMLAEARHLQWFTACRVCALPWFRV